MKCILCGKKIKKIETLSYDDPFNDLYEEPLATQAKESNRAEAEHDMQVCGICKAKLKLEADESQKVPKPI